ncbi:amino acid ABC transporter permease [Mesorhizobium sp. ANAO-SY3R2]|uniref:amino acid ABC transporter permease n=1 Tax=Mesorhizobium sp. ANAO-SY3R2 TaxID=3166644 RepID=UPI00366FB33C
MSATALKLRHRLFGTVGNSLLTLAMLAAFVAFVPPLLRWAVTDATWAAATPETCRANGGACWAFVHEKYRLILFGRYPYEQQWRPLTALALAITLVLASCSLRFGWRTVVAGWAAGVVTIIVLMRGGVLGLDYVPTDLWGGLPLTVFLALGGIVGAFPLAVVLALGRRSRLRLVKAICVAFIEMVRGVPLVTVLFMASFMIPLFLPGKVQADALLRALAAITLFSAAYLAEAIRGGLQAVPEGQDQAAEALGLTYWQTSLLVIVPQALRHAIPAMANLFIGLFKDTSLVGIVGLTDLLLATKQALGDPQWRSFAMEGYIFVALIYVAFCFFISRYSRSLERRLRRDHG